MAALASRSRRYISHPTSFASDPETLLIVCALVVSHSTASALLADSIDALSLLGAQPSWETPGSDMRSLLRIYPLIPAGCEL